MGTARHPGPIRVGDAHPKYTTLQRRGTEIGWEGDAPSEPAPPPARTEPRPPGAIPNLFSAALYSGLLAVLPLIGLEGRSLAELGALGGVEVALEPGDQVDLVGDLGRGRRGL